MSGEYQLQIETRLSFYHPKSEEVETGSKDPNTYKLDPRQTFIGIKLLQNFTR